MIIDGKKASAALREELKEKVSKLKSTYNTVPGLTVILVGEDPPSKIYVKNKEKSAVEVGINSEVIHYPDNIEEKVVLDKIKELNKNDKVSGILVQLPLPKHIDKRKVIETIDPSKDVDGLHPVNVGNLTSGYDSTIPCTPLGCYLLIKNTEKNLNGKHAVIIGRSNLNGKPMTQLLLKENCTVTITHSKTKDLKAECKRADIIVAAVGKPKLVKADWVKKDAIVIDVGINKTDSGLVGDVDFDEVSKIAKAITPVPGGVGPMTIACLLSNTVECFKRARSN
ncbi:MAG: bifunctional methylenetetrahydrofolate dehydrogenase/methenyltetrahydrofolate cyclohydrolase FolD [Alphaproteobacteria bacterium]|jgi:methylenetetrahydrofolate dehydrogenase (NADP+)/methenyltetrahydrofolate cyclohydrolase|nr:MAG: bifunctional methylenetetrahydrofolate dehydrogenase/methenyltetrahydrofolate cyclohydrolase FolD [Alphaproteobacteria bacterium]RUA15533.1 MAG: bifunctional methylenetetrahydrofolate dehydrogenase/methenyltetrahydrofolate cyclohydrolase FolD [Alphaproteobacteria bacterium]HIN07395.1 bifunctional methylenetetrahydrofolate dehydrogenase/methenyltetrahydrofolate cyclohydrolase FolD [Pelagibacteraceae bacterium]